MASKEAIGGPVPPAVLAFSRSLPRLFDEFERVVAREEMRQEIMDTRSDRTARRRVLASDYQIARLEKDPDALWEFRIVREVDGRIVRGADWRLDDFLRLRHADARAERLSIVDLARTQSLPGCYWHNVALVLIAFTEPYVGDFRWRGREERYEFEQVSGLGIPEDFFDPSSMRHYPRGVLILGGPGGPLRSLELRFTAKDTSVAMSLAFARQGTSDLPMPLRFDIERRAASTGASGETLRSPGRTLNRTTIEYSHYRRFTVTMEEKTRE